MMPETMDHNEFDFYEDLITPFSDFLKRLTEFKEHPNARLQERQEEEENKKEHLEEQKKDDQIANESIDLKWEHWLFNPPKMIFDLEKAMDEAAEAKAKKSVS